MDTDQTPKKACHNCRRQRLRCDRSYPHCNKCAAAGRECLGYGKLFRWTGAVASRGKLAGCSSAAGLPSGTLPAFTSAGPSGGSSPRWTEAPASTRNVSPEASARNGHGVLGVESPKSGEEDADAAVDGQLVVHSSSADSTPSNPWVLVDPLYQDLDSSHRYYLSYFTNRVCKDLVSHDLPDRNPFRSLLPLTRAQPLLQYIIIAASAAHMSNLLKAPLRLKNDNSDNAVTYSIEQASRRALRDALVAKQKALRLMHTALQDIESTGSDVILAAALFFVNVELIESGKHGWQAHLEGAGRIMAMLPESTRAADTALRDYMLSDCFIYFILGSAFMPANVAMASSYFEPSQIPLILERAAANSYLCCPPEILSILYSASQIANVPADVASSDEVAAAGLALIQQAQAFDVTTWAHDIRNTSYLHDAPIQSRIHAGSAHRLAACLYTLQAIPSMSTISGHDEVAEALSHDIFEHLASIPDDDPNFKATTWPTFIAGAETADRKRRQWVMDRLGRLVVNCPWGFLYTAMETLQVIWELDTKEIGGRSWVQTLKDPDLNFLIV